MAWAGSAATFSRRNAEGVSLQFCSKKLRQMVAGTIYAELDVCASHPTMLQARLASVGKRVPLLDEWVRDKSAVIAEISAELQRRHQVFQPGSEVRELVPAMINGASAEKWVREKWGVQGAPPKLAKFARDMQTVRASVPSWFPEVWKCTEGAGSDWKRRNRAVHLLMTALEDDVLEAMREALPRFGVQCDALTGDGLDCAAWLRLCGSSRSMGRGGVRAGAGKPRSADGEALLKRLAKSPPPGL